MCSTNNGITTKQETMTMEKNCFYFKCCFSLAAQLGTHKRAAHAFEEEEKEETAK